MKLSKETICEDTLYMISEYYRLNMEPFFSVLADDCVWLGIGNLLICGVEAIKAQFKDGYLMPPIEVEEPEFQVIETGSENQLMVLGEYLCYSKEGAEMICAAKQRITFCYRREKDGWRLYHMHVSNEWNELMEEEVFPVRVSTETYHHMQRILRESGKHHREKLVLKKNGETDILDMALIRYIEAANKKTIVHMMDKKQMIGETIKNLEACLPADFYRIHRSYLVNCDYVAKIERYQLTLLTGEQLPIPKERYTTIRNEISTRLRSKTKR